MRETKRRGDSWINFSFKNREHGIYSAHRDGKVFFHDVRVSSGGKLKSPPVFDMSVAWNRFQTNQRHHRVMPRHVSSSSISNRVELASMTRDSRSKECGPLAIQMENGRCVIVNEVSWRIVEELPFCGEGDATPSTSSSSSSLSAAVVNAWEREVVRAGVPGQWQSQIAYDVGAGGRVGISTGGASSELASTNAVAHLTSLPGGVVYSSGARKGMRACCCC